MDWRLERGRGLLLKGSMRGNMLRTLSGVEWLLSVEWKEEGKEAWWG